MRLSNVAESQPRIGAEMAEMRFAVTLPKGKKKLTFENEQLYSHSASLSLSLSLSLS